MPSGGSSGRGLAGSGLLPSAGSMFWISFGLTLAAPNSAASPDWAAVVSSAPPASRVASSAGVPDAASFLAPSSEDPCEPPDVSPPPQAAARARRAPVKNTQAIPRPRFEFRMFKISTSHAQVPDRGVLHAGGHQGRPERRRQQSSRRGRQGRRERRRSTRELLLRVRRPRRLLGD